MKRNIAHRYEVDRNHTLLFWLFLIFFFKYYQFERKLGIFFLLCLYSEFSILPITSK